MMVEEKWKNHHLITGTEICCDRALLLLVLTKGLSKT